MGSQTHVKQEKKNRGIRDTFMSTAKSNYDMPPLVLWNQVELKLALADICKEFNIIGDMESDNGNSFSYSIIVNFPTHFHAQMIKNQFANYDAVPSLINPSQLAKKNL